MFWTQRLLRVHLRVYGACFLRGVGKGIELNSFHDQNKLNKIKQLFNNITISIMKKSSQNNTINYLQSKYC